MAPWARRQSSRLEVWGSSLVGAQCGWANTLSRVQIFLRSALQKVCFAALTCAPARPQIDLLTRHTSRKTYRQTSTVKQTKQTGTDTQARSKIETETQARTKTQTNTQARTKRQHAQKETKSRKKSENEKKGRKKHSTFIWVDFLTPGQNLSFLRAGQAAAYPVKFILPKYTSLRLKRRILGQDGFYWINRRLACS